VHDPSSSSNLLDFARVLAESSLAYNQSKVKRTLEQIDMEQLARAKASAELHTSDLLLQSDVVSRDRMDGGTLIDRVMKSI